MGTSLKREVSLLLAGVCFLCLASPGFAAEKIQITEGHEKVELPVKVPKDDLFSKPLDFLKSGGGDGGASLIPSLPPPNSPAPWSKELLEKRNWMKGANERWDADAALKQIFGVREYKFENFDGKSKSNLEDLWGGSGSRNSQRPPGGMLDRPLSRKETDRDRRGLSSDPYSQSPEADSAGASKSGKENDENGGADAPIAELNLNRLFRPAQTGDPFSRLPSSLTRTPSGPNSLGQFLNSHDGQFGRTREQELRAREFEKLLKGQGSVSQSPKASINSISDGTRQEINPTKGKRVDDISGPAISGIASESLPGFSRTSRPGLFDSINARVLGASSLAPTIVAPPAARITEAKPPVLEIPRRKF